ncbi:RagB/SusD family nutrient uptake outer membrane protein [Pedobacter sp. SYSU D00535]|uniref:RagB/SusD family nutrient uptake outer membrane protein n=1 Tax=Pedobacter sp. SYSU D00535 TaxID=2810308 RepID=UPI001A963A98|nr:RagB/SusD family nutrient uptake outer membrane protein [Pedobacter sp. SYSU D00535]
MHNQHKLSVLLAAGLLLGIASCKKDFLDKNPPNSVSSEIFWASESDVQTGLAGVYSRLQQNFLGYERVYLEGLTDNAYLDPGNGNQSNMQVMTTGGINAGLTGAMTNMYSTPYRAISSVNYFLANVDRAPVSEANKNVYKAEVRFIRALAYFDLVQAFGPVPIYRTYFKTLDEYKIPKSTAAEVYAFIEEDLDFAIANLPDIKYNGHAVKGSAQGLKARVLVTQKKWDQAVPLLQDIINNAAGKFSLSNNYAALFRSSGQTNPAVNSEIMFSTQYLAPSNVHRTSPGAAGMNIEFVRDLLIQPYKDLVDDYQMKDGLPANESPLFNPASPYANRDPRLDLTIKLPGEVWRNPAGTVIAPPAEPATGFVLEKYIDLSIAPFTAATATATDVDLIHLRYADILLMYAEAKNELSGPDGTVYDAIDQVRGRPGINMPPVDRARYDTKEELREFIRHERRVEFAFEGQRYNDLKRWNIAHVKLPTLKTPGNTVLVFEIRNYLLPLPSSELLNNPQLEQNPDYR